MIPLRIKTPLKMAGASTLLLILVHCSSDSSDNILPPSEIKPVTQIDPARNVFQIGDQLELFVKEDQTLNGNYLIREGGYIVIPRAGRVNVLGLTREQAEPKVKEFLQKSQLKEASVIVERTAGSVSNSGAVTDASGQVIPRVLVYITGSVPRTGGHSIPVPNGKSVGVYEALLISGGVGKFALVDKVEVFRFNAAGKRKKAVIDLRPIIKGEADDPPISEGDIINVPAKVFGF
ncbi:MAG: polysaccharide biosynthesis/export family protein [Prosthecobacter sp.]|nr:polysaccharide biosynthesis/export family protein [Prosthecobacter sp.]